MTSKLPDFKELNLNKKMKNYREILENVIAKGGFFGMCAACYINNEEYAIQYILELSEQCHVDNIKRSWGDNLTNDIITFSEQHQSFKKRKYFNDDS
ncbi:MAG: hypothetical protein O9353_04080 [Bacteroidia bacterium]|nr:hypothetical protein [Bacteroidia bacterium]